MPVARGTKLEASISGVFVEVVGVNNLNMDRSRPAIANGHLTSGDAETYEAGITDGSCTFELQVDRTNSVHARLEDDEGDGTPRSFRITWSDGTTETFTGLVTQFAKAAERSGLLMANVTIQRSGSSVRG